MGGGEFVVGSVGGGDEIGGTTVGEEAIFKKKDFI